MTKHVVAKAWNLPVTNGRRYSVPQGGGAPSYISSLSAYDVAQLTGGLAPTNGNGTIASATPSEWINSDPGTVDLPAVIVAWSGGFKGTDTKLRVHGGGHQDSANNGIYVYDFAGTTVPTGWTVEGQSAVADVQEGSAYADGRPRAIHSYDHCIFIDGACYRFGGAPWASAGGFSTDSWRFTTTWASRAAMPSYAQCVTVHDPATGKIFLAKTNDFVAQFYRISANTWSSTGAFFDHASTSDAVAALDTSRSRAIMIGGSANVLMAIDFVNETFSSSTFSPSGATAILARTGLSAFYDAALDCYWIFGGGTASEGYVSIYQMNASTFAITERPLSASMATAGFQSNYVGSYGRFCFMDDWRAIGFVTRTDAAPYVIKLP